LNLEPPIFETRCLSSLTKVFADSEIIDPIVTSTTALLKETVSFQIAYRASKIVKGLKVAVNSGFLNNIAVRNVGLVPSELPCYPNHDDFVLRDTPGLYPDPLYPITEDQELIAFPGQWRSLWITVIIPEDCPAGDYSIVISISDEEKTCSSQETFSIEVIPQKLPDQKLIHTEWFNTDCLATWYGVEVFSSEHWKLIDCYMENAAKHGINMLYTPIFTPPIETKIGNERLTTQLVSIQKQGDIYHFDFSLLDVWIEKCQAYGIQYLEMAHLFTQWGARHAPKILVLENNKLKQLFGWHTDSQGEDYTGFLKQFLPALVQYLDAKNLHGRVYFHISDEPRTDRLEEYTSLSKLVKELIGDYPIMDAISELEIYESSAMNNPVPSNDEIDIFLENKVENLWTYYCCMQGDHYLSNRFFNLPSTRNRIIGLQLYKYDLKGFLHWGYNHWYTGLSVKEINPFLNTDAGYCFPSGDAFLVYPGETGPIDSIRSEVFYEALQDLRALQLLEEWIGKEKVLQLLEEDAGPITFRQYPHELLWLLDIRNKINRMIKELAGC